MSTLQERARRVESYVDGRARTLQARYLADVARAVAELAKLRRGVNTEPGSDLELLGLALANAEGDPTSRSSLFADPASLGDEITPEERSAYVAVTLFAMHQQSRRDAPMHGQGISLGRAARRLARDVGRDSVRQRFVALGTATTWDETVHHARGLIQQFRQHRIPLDYGLFARDLFDLHTGRGHRVRTRWGRDFYRLDDSDDAPASDDEAPASDELADNH